MVITRWVAEGLKILRWNENELSLRRWAQEFHAEVLDPDALGSVGTALTRICRSSLIDPLKD